MFTFFENWRQYCFIVEYLNDPKFAQKGRDQYGSKVTKKELQAKVSKTIFKLYSIKDDSDDEEEQRDSSTLFAGNENLSYTERLKIHLQQSQNLLPKSSGEPTKVHAGLIKQELNLFHDTDGKEKSKYLQALHESLCAIPPTSVESVVADLEMILSMLYYF